MLELLRLPPCEQHDLTAISRDILYSRDTSRAWRKQAIEKSVLDNRARAFIYGNEATLFLQFLRRPPREIAPDSERTSHRDVEAIAQRHSPFGHEVGTIRNPAHHHPRCVRVTEPLLNA